MKAVGIALCAIAGYTAGYNFGLLGILVVVIAQLGVIALDVGKKS
jgi:hypothetical protein